MDDRTEIKDLGEFELIAKITEGIKLKQTTSLVGVGDDAAVLDSGSASAEAPERIVVTTDMLCEGVHFDLTYAPLKHLGYKAVVVNLSDVCAMNATPTQITVGLGISNRFSVEAVEELYSGIHLACERYGVDLIGGDTTSSPSGLTLAITALGRAPADSITLRQGADESDLLVVSGELGSAYMGLQVLEREKHVFKEAPGAQPELTGYDELLERQLKPEARVDVVKELAQLQVIPKAMIDISDGLASESLHLAAAAKKGVRIYEDKIPMNEKMYETAREFNLDPTLCALSGGEDYELLFVVAQSQFESLQNHPMFSIIGHFTGDPEDRTLVLRNGGEAELKAQGWDSVA
ncbi:MAG: thiamine-phosphate kinase [Flavobacteriales bacterium]|nr:thiamine-phosphate kinase [Flavobacteriales bacterium]